MNVYCNDSIEDESLDFYSDSMHKKSRFKVEFDFERATILIVILLLLLFLPVWLICFLSRSASRLHWSSYDYFHRKQESLKKRFEATNKTPVNVYDDKDDDDPRCKIFVSCLIPLFLDVECLLVLQFTLIIDVDRFVEQNNCLSFAK